MEDEITSFEVELRRLESKLAIEIMRARMIGRPEPDEIQQLRHDISALVDEIREKNAQRIAMYVTK